MMGEDPELTKALAVFEAEQPIGGKGRTAIRQAWAENRSGAERCIKAAAQRRSTNHAGLLVRMIGDGDHLIPDAPPSSAATDRAFERWEAWIEEGVWIGDDSSRLGFQTLVSEIDHGDRYGPVTLDHRSTLIAQARRVAHNLGEPIAVEPVKHRQPPLLNSVE